MEDSSPIELEILLRKADESLSEAREKVLHLLGKDEE